MNVQLLEPVLDRAGSARFALLGEATHGTHEFYALRAALTKRRFPAWMWRNEDVVEFVGWLREFNDALPRDAERVGCYGLDLYSLYSSIEAVVAYLERTDPRAAARARERYGCLEHLHDAQSSGYSVGAGLPETYPYAV